MDYLGKNLLFEILASANSQELLPFERLYVAETSTLPKHQGFLADIYLACGCFDAASKVFQAAGHTRKLGDLAWAVGNLEEAERHYSSVVSGPNVFRRGKDWDRLIKLAFFKTDFERVATLVSTAPIQPGLGPGRIILGSSEGSGLPILQMFAVALAKGASLPSGSSANSVAANFEISASKFGQLIAAAQEKGDSHIQKLQRLCPPRIAKTPCMSTSDALSRGSTSRAKALLAFLDKAEHLLASAKASLKTFAATGNTVDLTAFLQVILLPGIMSVSHAFLFHSLSGFQLEGVPAERLVQLFGCHPVMDKRYFGEFLQLKFRSGALLTGRDVLTGIFQKMGSIPLSVTAGELFTKRILDFNRLVGSRDWAEMRLGDWLEGPGSELSQHMSKMWLDGTPEKVSGPFGHRNGRPDSPRSMAEWGRMVDAALAWLEDRWNTEIGITPWVSENKLFEILKKAFSGYQVERHAQPVWHAPQHLDVFVPELNLAVEFMGQQHYEPVDFFGGAQGFAQTVERDQRKQKVCRSAGIALEYVRYDEDVGARAACIKRSYQTSQ